MHEALLDPVLDPDALLKKLDELRDQRERRPEKRKVPDELYAAIRSALTSPEYRSDTPSASTVRDPQDHSRPPATVYLHPHAALSQFQSVVADCFEAQLVGLGKLEPSLHGIKRFIRELEIRFRRFGPCDFRWIEPVLEELQTDLTESKHPFVDKRPAVVPLGDRAKVVIVGDWATALPQARNVANSIREHLRTAPGGVDTHVIHLGDTYYSGTRHEYKHRYLPFWPVDTGSLTGSWSLNGNHDMYSGGHGLFEVLLRDSRFARQAGCSYFSLGNQHWQFVGLDDSWVNPDVPQLAESQISWLGGLLATGAGTILLTHHQPFSAWEEVHSALAGEVAQALGEHRVEGWIWGHEHRAAVYEPGIDYGDYHDLAEYTAIAGHGGVPNLVSGPEVTPPGKAVDAKYVRWQSTDYYTVAEDTWSYGGFAVVDLDGPRAQVQFFTELGRPRTDPHGQPVAPDQLRHL